MNGSKLTAAVVGCRMGAAHAAAIASLPEYELAALCDLKAEVAEQVVKSIGKQVPVFSDYSAMLREVRPDVIAIATPNNLHCRFTVQAAESGVKGICCEKPMAVSMSEARRMVQVCKEKGVSLIVNHQRRMGAELIKAKSVIDSTILGDIRWVRGECAGDILSDGTHLLDSILFLTGDSPAEWVMGQVHREVTTNTRKDGSLESSGFRYGHAIENGGFAVIRLASKVRIEIFCGDLRSDRSAYQDYTVVGTKGMLWRTGDEGDNLFITSRKEGEFNTGIETWYYKPKDPSSDGIWKPVKPDIDRYNSITASYRRFAQTIHEGQPHPLCGENSIRSFEIIMSIYESARTGTQIRLPLQQDNFPLDLWIQERKQEKVPA